MNVNTPNEWQKRSAWIDGRIQELLTRDDHSPRAHEVLTRLSANGVTEEMVRELDRLVGQEQVEEHLALALAARSITLRSVTTDGDLVMVEWWQVDECRVVAERILGLQPNQELASFAKDLRQRVEISGQWTWAGRSTMPVHLLLITLLGVLPVLVGGANGSAAAVVVGVVLGGFLMFMTVIRHRKPIWLVRAEQLAPRVMRVGR